MGPASPLLVFSGNANKSLAERICAYLGIPMGDAQVGRFPDGEISVKIQSDVRGADVFVVQSTCAPVNDHLMELLIMVDALKRASAARITTVIPYFGYARQIQASGADRVLTIDLHAAQIQGFFDIPLDHLYAMRVFAKYVRKLELGELVVASPDVGGMKTAWSYAKRFGARLAVVEKRRTSAENVEVGFVIGDVENKNVILVDDLIATGGTIAKAAKLLREKGAREVFIMATHAVFCGRAIEKLREAPVKEIIVTDTIPVTASIDRLNVLSVAELLGEAVHRIHTNKSVSLLFKRF
jgi:ribose-phosphate pyrophosphokinase